MVLSEKTRTGIISGIAVIIAILVGILLFHYVIRPKLGPAHEHNKPQNPPGTNGGNSPDAPNGSNKPDKPKDCKPDCIGKECGTNGCGGFCGGENPCGKLMTCDPTTNNCVRKSDPDIGPQAAPITTKSCTASKGDMFDSAKSKAPQASDCRGCCPGLVPYLVNPDNPDTEQPRKICFSPFDPNLPNVGTAPGQLTKAGPIPYEDIPCFNQSSVNWLDQFPFASKLEGETNSNVYGKYFNKQPKDIVHYTSCSTLFKPHSCDSDENDVDKSSCGFINAGTKTKCIKDKWDPSYYNSCCNFSPEILDNGKIDIAKCALINNEQVRNSGTNIAWAPVSAGCLGSDSMMQYCSDIDPVTGKSRLLSKGPGGQAGICQQWCGTMDAEAKKNKSASKCDAAKIAFCNANPNAAECLCSDPQHNAFYQQLMAQAEDLGLTPACAQPPICWLPICSGADLDAVLLTNEQKELRKTCKACDRTICEQIIEVKDNKVGKIVIEGNTFKQVCEPQGGKKIPANK